MVMGVKPGLSTLRKEHKVRCFFWELRLEEKICI